MFGTKEIQWGLAYGSAEPWCVADSEAEIYHLLPLHPGCRVVKKARKEFRWKPASRPRTNPTVQVSDGG